MIKESILFVVATGVLIYFVTPSDEPAQPDPGPEVIPKVVTRAPQPSNDGWGNDEPENEDESFVFGEPLVNLNSNYGDTSSDDAGRDQSAAFASSPGGSRSMDDPMEFKPRAGPHPSDH